MSDSRHYFETAQICLDGHVATLNYGRNVGERTDYCPTCGKITIHECPICRAPIRGAHYTEKVVTTSINILEHTETRVMHEQRVDKSEYKIPAYCHNCGEPYPWTKAALDAAAELIDEEMNELTGEEKSTFKAALPDVVAQNPRTTLASRRISKCLKKNWGVRNFFCK